MTTGEAIEVADLNLSAGASPAQACAGDASLHGSIFSDAKKQMIEDFEREFLLSALRENEGNISRTAQEIGVHRTHLHDKIKEHDIDVDAIKQEFRR